MNTTTNDLTTPEGVARHMENSATAQEWDANCDAVKKANGGYPEFWYQTIILSGLAARVTATFD